MTHRDIGILLLHLKQSRSRFNRSTNICTTLLASLDEAADFLGLAAAERRGQVGHQFGAGQAEDLAVAVGGPDRPALRRDSQ